MDKLESFYLTHNYLVKKVQSPVRRLLTDEINWDDRLIGIKGSRGVGKTTFLLQYAKDKFGTDRKCLYVNFNNFYFTVHTLVEFATDFYTQGGRVLLLDQTFKYENWSKELRECYYLFPDLKIVFSGSSVMRLIEDNEDLKDIVKVYNLRGFSFREYLNLKLNVQLPSYDLQELIHNNQEISKSIQTQFNPFDYFNDYLIHGYYPFFLENRNFSENLLKTLNMMLEVDILLIKQIDLKYLSKIRKLVYLILTNSPGPANVSQLSVEIQTSRATIMNYIKYLKDARILNLLYLEGEDFSKKPKQIYVHNTNLLHAVYPEMNNREAELKTFLYNSLHSRHKVNLSRYHNDFCVDYEYHIKFDTKSHNRHGSKTYYAIDKLETEHKHEIPLWLFGFLY